MSVLRGADAAERSALRDLGAAVGVVLAVTAAYFALSSPGARAEDRRERCAALLDKYVVLRQRAADPSASPTRVEAQLREVRAEALSGDGMRACLENLAESSARCAEAANTADEIERCFR